MWIDQGLTTMAAALPMAQAAASEPAPALDWLAVAFRVAHVLAAVTLAGGIIFQRGVLIPASRAMEAGDRDKLDKVLRGYWSRLVMIAVLFLIGSGFYNYAAAIQLNKAGTIQLPGYYHAIMGIKMLLAFAVFFMTSVLSGRSAAADRFREKASFWMTLNSLAAILVIILGGVLKTSDRTPLPSAPSDAPAASVVTQSFVAQENCHG